MTRSSEIRPARQNGTRTGRPAPFPVQHSDPRPLSDENELASRISECALSESLNRRLAVRIARWKTPCAAWMWKITASARTAENASPCAACSRPPPCGCAWPVRRNGIGKSSLSGVPFRPCPSFRFRERPSLIASPARKSASACLRPCPRGGEKPARTGPRLRHSRTDALLLRQRIRHTAFITPSPSRPRLSPDGFHPTASRGRFRQDSRTGNKGEQT